MPDNRESARGSNRRNFMKGSSALLAGSAVAGSLNIARSAHAFGSDIIKVGLVGCGGRGTGAAVQALNTTGGDVQLTAVADLYSDRIETALHAIERSHPKKLAVASDKQFVGFDGFERVIDSDVDLVILATSPGFRPLHCEAAIQAGKHVFMEKPCATDAPGVRRLLAAGELAQKNGLCIQVGLQRHHENRYREVVEQVHGGAIGEVIFARAYWNSPGVWIRPRRTTDSELQYQCRNWYYFNWLCGDHINEQHIHNLDVINWVMQGYPVEAQGQGGRQVRTGSDTGQIFDHHFVEYTYGSGAKLMSQCRHIRGCWRNVGEVAHGTKGYAVLNDAEIYDHNDKLIWKSEANKGHGGHQDEHHDMFAALRRGDRPNECEYGAKSTMTSILGRLATYSGKRVRWDDAINSEVALADFDSIRSWDSLPPVMPDEDGNYPIPVPGRSKVL